MYMHMYMYMCMYMCMCMYRHVTIVTSQTHHLEPGLLLIDNVTGDTAEGVGWGRTPQTKTAHTHGGYK